MPERVARLPSLYTLPDSPAASPALRGGRCRACERVFFPEQHFGCEACGAPPEALEPELLEGVGTLEAFARAHRMPGGTSVLGIVRLDAGLEVETALEAEAGELAIGARVRAVLVPDGSDDEGRERVACRFAPASGAGA